MAVWSKVFAMQRKFIVNARASGLSAGGLERLAAWFRRRTGRFDCALARTRAEAVAQTRQALHEGADQLVAVGGDGTLNAVLNGMLSRGRPIRPECVLATAGLGTGGDYFRTMTRHRRCDWRRLVLCHRARPVDVGSICYTDRPESPQYFLNMASVGLIAEVVRRKNAGPRHLPGLLRYALPMLGAFCSCRPVRMQIDTHDESFEAEYLAVSICKGVWAGRGIRFGGAVGLDDGRLDVTLFAPLPRAKMLAKIPRLYAGRFAGEPSVRKLRARRLSIRCAQPQAVEFDGEVHGWTDIEVEVLPRAVRVCFPDV